MRPNLGVATGSTSDELLKRTSPWLSTRGFFYSDVLTMDSAANFHFLPAMSLDFLSSGVGPPV